MPGHYDNGDPPKWHEDPLTRALTKLEALEERLQHFVTDEEFKPVRMIVYGMAGLILMTVLGIMIARAIGAK